MKVALLILISFALSSTSFAHRISRTSALVKNAITYDFIGPIPFNDLKIEIKLEEPDGYSRKISEIIVHVGTAIYVIDKKELEIDFSPKLDSIRFLYKTLDKLNGELNSAWIQIPYGKIEYVDCGVDTRIGLFKTKKILISPFNPPEVTDDTMKYGRCAKAESEILKGIEWE